MEKQWEDCVDFTKAYSSISPTSQGPDVLFPNSMNTLHAVTARYFHDQYQPEESSMSGDLANDFISSTIPAEQEPEIIANITDKTQRDERTRRMDFDSWFPRLICTAFAFYHNAIIDSASASLYCSTKYLPVCGQIGYHFFCMWKIP